MFAGRDAELAQGTRLLLQAANGAPRHGLIVGPPGIGKSSLAGAIRGVACGDRAYLELIGSRPDELAGAFLVVYHSAMTTPTLDGIATALIASLERQTGVTLGLSVTQVDIDVKLVKVHLERTSPIGDVVNRLVDEIRDTWGSVRHDLTGIVLVLDDLDKIADLKGLGVFLKATAESLAREDLRNVALLIVGAEGVLEELREDHGSIGRLFEIISVPPLSDDDVRDLIDSVAFNSPLSIDDAAREQVVRAASGFPNDVHLIGYTAFDLADDEGATSITAAHVQAALEKLAGIGGLQAPRQ